MTAKFYLTMPALDQEQLSFMGMPIFQPNRLTGFDLVMRAIKAEQVSADVKQMHRQLCTNWGGNEAFVWKI